MLVRLIRDFLRPYRRQLLVLVVLQAVQALANLYLPSLNADLINHGVLPHHLGHIWRIGGLMLAVSLVQLLFTLAAVYTASKMAMAFGRDVRSALFHRVTGYSARELNDFGAPSLDIDAYSAMIPLKRIAVPDDIVGPVLFLLGPDSRYMTGQTLWVNGGAYMP